MFKENLKMAWLNLLYNKMRTFLTMLGIIIGVASIVALITIVKGAMNGMTSEFSSFGADKITIQALGTPLKQGLTDQDIKKLEEIDQVVGVSPTLTGATSVVYSGIEKKDVMVQGKNDVFFLKTKDLIETGRSLNPLDIESKNHVCLIGANIADELFWGVNPVGEKLLINGVSYTVVGTLKQTSDFAASSNNDSVIIPYTTSMGLLGTGYITNVDVYMEDANESEAITANIETILNQAFNYKDNSFTIMNMQEMIASFNKVTTMLSLMLGGIASISLVVGGIGIMNMMLVSVTERTAEIGLRKALGAAPKRIQQQFLMEAVFLSLFGGTVGLLLGSLIAFAVCFFIGASFTLAISTILLAFGFSTAIGIIFGLAPAKKASNLNPIDALRSA